VGLLAYSQWLWDLIGKFLTGEKHPNARINLFPQFARYNSAQCAEAKLYQEIARKKWFTLTELSLAFIEQQSFVTSTLLELQQWNN
jgi:aryl-alcohol dehydrogenase-like predicted oxidoreductase